MPKKLSIVLLAFLLIFAMMLMADTGERLQMTPVTDGDPVAAPMLRGPCSLWLPGGGTMYFDGYEYGMKCVSLFNPANCPDSPPYPFLIKDFSFRLYDWGPAVWPVEVDVVFYDPAVQENPCSGPGTEIYRMSHTCTADSFAWPEYGTVNIPAPFCVDGPFFVGIQYTDPGAGPFPAVSNYQGAPDPDTCHVWYDIYQGWKENSEQWSEPEPGYPQFWLNGEVGSVLCPENCPITYPDGHKMHDYQHPRQPGCATNATQPELVADNFMCTQDGPITEVHFWGAWRHNTVGEINSFTIRIFSDRPPSPPVIPYNRPHTLLWQREVYQTAGQQLSLSQPGIWYDPSTGEMQTGDYSKLFQYNVCFEPDDPGLFYQDSGTVYWLSVSANVADTFTTRWGWQSTYQNWEDHAVWLDGGLWDELWEPWNPLYNNFDALMDPLGNFIGDGDMEEYGDGWYYYPMDDWWNIWWYDHPYDTTRRKFGYIGLWALPVEEGHPESLEVAINWSTDQWLIDNPGINRPPMPWEDEILYIGREIVYVSYDLSSGWEEINYELPIEYNPEWVSVDVRGTNFRINNGLLVHDCRGPLDLAFVVNSPEPVPEGACCYDPTGGPDEASCLYTTQTYCEQTLGGVYQGDNVQCQGMEACCLPNGDCVMADVLCCVNELSGTPQGPGSVCTTPEACCLYDAPFTCLMVDPLCCGEMGGYPMGPGSACQGIQACCSPDGTVCWEVDAECCGFLGGIPQGPGSQCTAAEACCMPDGSCQMLDPVCCVNQGGTPQGPGIPCLGSEACCLQNGDCVMADIVCCVEELGGIPQGPGSQCLGAEACCMSNGDCVMADALCCVNELSGIPQGPGSQCTAPVACCLPDGSCQTLAPLCCDDLGGVPQGSDDQCTAVVACCLPDGSCQMLDPVCCDDQGGVPQGADDQCTDVEACCLTDGSCQMLDPVCCDDQGGTPQGPGSQCTAAVTCCLPDGSCQVLDPLCCEDQGGSPQGADDQCTAAVACCLPDGSCQMLDPVCCDDQGGIPQGADDQCTAAVACCMPDGSCQMLDPVCCDDQGGIPQDQTDQCTAVEACCMADGSCQILDPVCCEDQGGIPQGPAAQCTAAEACCLPDGRSEPVVCLMAAVRCLILYAAMTRVESRRVRPTSARLSRPVVCLMAVVRCSILFAAKTRVESRRVQMPSARRPKPVAYRTETA
jgi:hypothetical protein